MLDRLSTASKAYPTAGNFLTALTVFDDPEASFKTVRLPPLAGHNPVILTPCCNNKHPLPEFWGVFGEFVVSQAHYGTYYCAQSGSQEVHDRHHPIPHCLAHEGLAWAQWEQEKTCGV
ncbi:hypothetical protein DL96DRAFT_1562850 [Flagelloscypha sp. PMI_526]|nr:hypothetical protein DL96DRAFT_1562850 [Flagelloscypha sp. PMI_526]